MYDCVISDWAENPPLVHLVEALVYGLSGGKKETPEPSDLDQFDFNKIRPLPSRAQLAGSAFDEKPITVGDLSQLNRTSGGLFPVLPKDPGLPPPGVITLNMDEMRRRNEARIAKKYAQAG